LNYVEFNSTNLWANSIYRCVYKNTHIYI